MKKKKKPSVGEKENGIKIIEKRGKKSVPLVLETHKSMENQQQTRPNRLKGAAERERERER